jgi:RNA polymerase sigma factor (sigma-70 family)
MIKDDARLLREYVSQHSKTAFTKLVGRYIDLVYSTALRMVCEPSLAEDVVQMVFVQLMTKASTIRNGNTLPGWLYRVTRCQAVNAVRAEQTRRRHEVEASMQAHTETNAAWELIGPELDEAMASLNAEEQNVMVMRFFQERPWRDIGAALAVSEDTAQRRARQALNNLRTYFSGKGIAVTGTALSMAVSANAVQTAPVGMVSTVAYAALAHGGSAASVGIMAFLKSLLAHKVAILVVAAAVTVGIGTTIINRTKGIGGSSNVVHELPASLTDDLVLYFSFDSPQDSNHPNRIVDESPARNHGELTGGRIQTGPFGLALRCRAENETDGIIVPDSDSLDLNAVTVTAWIKTDLQDAQWNRILDKGWTQSYNLCIGGDFRSQSWYRTRGRFECVRQGLTSNTPVTDDRWHFLVGSYDGRIMKLYVDGQLDNQRSLKRAVPMKHNTVDLRIGQIAVPEPTPYDRPYFDGMIDEVRLYKRVLTDEEVELLYRYQPGR